MRYFRLFAAFVRAETQLALEYRAIVDAGFVLQIDSPNTADDWQRYAEMSVPEFRAYTERNIQVLRDEIISPLRRIASFARSTQCRRPRSST